jgi:hypothetical protein
LPEVPPARVEPLNHVPGLYISPEVGDGNPRIHEGEPDQRVDFGRFATNMVSIRGMVRQAVPVPYLILSISTEIGGR